MKKTIPKRNNPKVSVLLPFYNAVSTLEAAVASIGSQSFTDWELLLLDDGSTDESAELADSMAARDPRIRVVHRSHQGIVPTLCCGLDLAQGAFIARMDADDICLPERFAEQLQYLEAHSEVDVVSCQVAYGGDRKKQSGYAAYVDWQNHLLTPDDHFANRFVDAPVAHPSVLWRREVSERCGGYREGNFPEDFEMWLRWMEQGVTFAKIPSALMIWNDPPHRLSRQDSRYNPEIFYEIKCQYLNNVLPEDRPVWLWGSGRTTRKRFNSLEPFAGYIDVDSEKTGHKIKGLPVVSPAEIPADAFVLSGVAARGARLKIKSFLDSAGRKAVQDYLICA